MVGQGPVFDGFDRYSPLCFDVVYGGIIIRLKIRRRERKRVFFYIYIERESSCRLFVYKNTVRAKGNSL